MTTSVTDNVLATHTGTDAVSQYAFSFPTFADEDVGVAVRKISNGVRTELVLTTDFTVEGAGLSAGNINLVNAGQTWLTGAFLSSDYEIWIYYKPLIKQLVTFRNLGRNYPIKIEQGLDRVTRALKGLLGDYGEIGQAIKLPENLLASEFDPRLPTDVNTPNYLLAVNPTGDGFVVVSDAGVGGYNPGVIQVIGAGGNMSISAVKRQHIRVQSDGGVKALANRPFGTDPAKFSDGMEILVEAQSTGDYLTLAENDSQYGYLGLGTGTLEFKRGVLMTFIYSATLERFLLKSTGAW